MHFFGCTSYVMQCIDWGDIIVQSHLLTKEAARLQCPYRRTVWLAKLLRWWGRSLIQGSGFPYVCSFVYHSVSETHISYKNEGHLILRQPLLPSRRAHGERSRNLRFSWQAPGPGRAPPLSAR